MPTVDGSRCSGARTGGRLSHASANHSVRFQETASPRVWSPLQTAADQSWQAVVSVERQAAIHRSHPNTYEFPRTDARSARFALLYTGAADPSPRSGRFSFLFFTFFHFLSHFSFSLFLFLPSLFLLPLTSLTLSLPLSLFIFIPFHSSILSSSFSLSFSSSCISLNYHLSARTLVIPAVHADSFLHESALPYNHTPIRECVPTYQRYPSQIP